MKKNKKNRKNRKSFIVDSILTFLIAGVVIVSIFLKTLTPILLYATITYLIITEISKSYQIMVLKNKCETKETKDVSVTDTSKQETISQKQKLKTASNKNIDNLQKHNKESSDNENIKDVTKSIVEVIDEEEFHLIVS